MKKTCRNCFAAETGAHPLEDRPITGCRLGYKNEDGKPLEDCPKPQSWKQLNRITKEERKWKSKQ